MSALTDFWIASYRKARGVSYIGFNRSDAVILQKLARKPPEGYGEQTVRTLIGRFLKLEEPWIRQAGWSVKAFAQRIRGLYPELVAEFGERAVQEANERREAMRHAPAEVTSLVDRIGRG